MDAIKCIGNCFLMFLIAVVFDVLGVILLLIGIFANLRINGLFYGDFLIYTGSLIIFISLACWLMWYVGNVQVSVDDGCKKRNSIVQLARKLSERLTMKLKGGEESMKCVEDEESSHGGSSPHKASRVTWGRSTAYSNEGYDTSSEPSVQYSEKEGWYYCKLYFPGFSVKPRWALCLDLFCQTCLNRL